MNNYIGIDLGTTNSAICSYDGTNTRIWKSPDQNDVTPSALYFDRRSMYVGSKAYRNAALNPDHAAILFKRFMGTDTLIKISAINKALTPEDCSAEILKTLFGYLPEEIREDDNTGTVITVPAAFSLMQKESTKQAAYLAGIGKVALMQEPVAAVMSVMKTSKSDAIFLIYDMGGGTLDVAIAESTNSHVNLLAHDGIQMCGGRDFDKAIFQNIMKPWLDENFSLPDNYDSIKEYKNLIRIGEFAAEEAKIELSSKDSATIFGSESDIRIKDLDGTDIYFDITISRDDMNELIRPIIDQSIEKAHDTITSAGYSASDFEKIVFVGGPTNYKYLRDQISESLGIPANIDVNPMTAVAEGASIFAESIDWSSENRTRKSARGHVNASNAKGISFNYIQRTPEIRARVVAVLESGFDYKGYSIQVDSLDTGWTSGKIVLSQNFSIDLQLTKNGENIFKVFIFDSIGTPIKLESDRITITRTAATVDSIPASKSICIEALNKLNAGASIPVYLLQTGDQLPKKGTMTVKAAEMLRAGENKSLNFNLWEGEIKDKVRENEFVGAMKIYGTDFDEGVIYAGADIVCDYEINDAGVINLEVSIPCIASTFKNEKNFYTSTDSKINYLNNDFTIKKAESVLKDIDNLGKSIDDPKLDETREKLESAIQNCEADNDPETTKKSNDEIREVNTILAKIREQHRQEIRKLELDDVVDDFNKHCRDQARESERLAFDNLARTAQRSIDKNLNDFEGLIKDLRQKRFDILWRQDWYVIDVFKYYANADYLYNDKQKYTALVTIGSQYIKDGNIEKLKEVIYELFGNATSLGSSEDMASVNIIAG